MTELFAEAVLNNVLECEASFANVVISSNPPTGNATVSDVLVDKTFSNAYYIDLIGTMPNIGKEDFTPSTVNQVISEGYHDGTGVIAGDADLIADNIKKDASIFGVVGSFEGDFSGIKDDLDAANEESSADVDAAVALVDSNYVAIKAAIEAKDVDMTGIKPSGYDDKITATLEKFEPYPIDMTGIDVAAWYDPENTRTTLVTASAQVDGGIVLSLGEQHQRNVLLATLGTTPVLSTALGKKTLLTSRVMDSLFGVKFFTPPITLFMYLNPTVEPDTLAYQIPVRWHLTGYIGAGGSTFAKKFIMAYAPGLVLTSTKEATINVGAVVSAVAAPNNQQLWVNGGNNVSATNAVVSATTDFTVGYYSSIYRFKGHIGDVIIIRGILSDEKREEIEDYLMAKWSVASERP